MEEPSGQAAKKLMIAHEKPNTLLQTTQKVIGQSTRPRSCKSHTISSIFHELSSSIITLNELRTTLIYCREHFEETKASLLLPKYALRLCPGGHYYRPLSYGDCLKKIYTINRIGRLLKRYYDTMKILGYVHPHQPAWQYSKYLPFPIPVAQMITYYSASDICKKK
jgi:hypothetical protein